MLRKGKLGVMEEMMAGPKARRTCEERYLLNAVGHIGCLHDVSLSEPSTQLYSRSYLSKVASHHTHSC